MLENVKELGPELCRCDAVQIRAAAHHLARMVLRLMTSRQDALAAKS